MMSSMTSHLNKMADKDNEPVKKSASQLAKL